MSVLMCYVACAIHFLFVGHTKCGLRHYLLAKPNVFLFFVFVLYNCGSAQDNALLIFQLCVI